MMTEAKIYGKEQQIKLIDNILCSLCNTELNPDGRKYLKLTREKITKEIEYLKRELESEQHKKIETGLQENNLKFSIQNKSPW